MPPGEEGYEEELARGRRVGDEVRDRRDLVREREERPGVDRQVHEEPRLVRQVPPHESRTGRPADDEQARADERGRHVRLRQHEGQCLPPGRGLRRQGGPGDHEERVGDDEEHDGRPEDAVPRHQNATTSARRPSSTARRATARGRPGLGARRAPGFRWR
ncbi:hypothetical protein M2316_003606 [Cellulosimicrobium cellulans]|nr:hypothetical protein [Cellulosimicrobium cellulans]MDF9878254.1 hypothetical protein [Cellulosimicrobium cellulans]